MLLQIPTKFDRICDGRIEVRKMLVRYKKSLEKIAMGLLSFMPQEKDVKRLMETISGYESNDDWQLFLWKKDDEYVGVLGIVKQEATAIIQHITVVPSYRGEGVAMEMLADLQELETFDEIESNEETAPFLNKCLPTLKAVDSNS